MWNSFFSRVTQAVAPDVQTPTDQFKECWRQIKSFYIAKKQNLEEEGIPQALNKMVQILLEEEDRLCSNNPTPLPGPCLDLFFREGVLQFLCSVCVRDTPPGMRKLTMAAISNLLRSAQYIPLLPHQSVQVPLSKLTKSCLDMKLEQGEKSASFDEEYLALLETISLKIQEIPSCIHFFFNEDHGQSSFPIFDCLIMHIHQHDTRGERSRQACERLLQVSASHRGDEIMKYILSTDFSSRVVSCTVECYTNICNAYATSAEITSTYLNCLIFCSKILSVSPEQVCNEIMAGLQKELFLGLLIPDFMSEENLCVIQSSAFMQYYFRYVKSPTMLGLLWKLLLGNQKEPETREGKCKNQLRNQLLCRMNAADDSVALASMGIVGSLLELHDEEVTHNLVLRNIPVLPLSTHEMVQNSSTSKKWFQSITLTCDDTGDKDILPYIHDAQLAVYQSYQKTSDWKYEFVIPQPEHIYEGELLDHMFTRLENLLHNSEIVNYSITELFLKLLRLPHPAIYSYFLNTSQDYPSSFKTLKNSMLEISQAVLEQSSDISGFSEKAELVKHQMEQPDHISKYYSSSGIPTEEKAFLCNAIIFEEFTRELVAIIHSKTTQNILAR